MAGRKVPKSSLLKPLQRNRSARFRDLERKSLLQRLRRHELELVRQNRKLLEIQQDLELSRNRYADLYDFAPVGYINFDANSCIQQINLAGAKLLGEERSKLVGLSFVRFVERNDTDKFIAHVQHCLVSSEKVTLQLRLRVRNQELVHVQMTSVAQTNEDQLTICRTVVTDITELKLAEEALRRSERQLRLITDHLPVFISYVDSDQRFRFNNKKYEEWLGIPRSQIYDRSIKETFGEKLYREIHPSLIQALSGTTATLDHEIVLAEGRRTLHSIYLPHIEEGKVKGVFTLSTDISERVQIEKILRESEQSQKEFVANVSHEFRTPLSAIKGFAETLKRGGLDDKKNRLAFIQTIEKHADRLSHLVEEVLVASALESGKRQVKPEPVQLSEFAREFVRSIAPLAGKKQLKIRIKLQPKTQFWVDKTHLHEIFQNLFSNAINYNRPGGSILLSSRHKNGRGEILIRDTGIGISKADLPHIFKRFYRAKKTGTQEVRNSGLGLYIVKQLVEANKGKVWAESIEGKGSTFFFTLPQSPSKTGN